LALFFYSLRETALMKKLIYIYVFLVAFVLSSCVGTNYYLKQGNYDAAIQMAVEKLRKNPNKADKHILALEQAWKIEQGRITDRIEFLKLDGSPESWIEIHNLYAELDGYQKAITPIFTFVH
jgi:tetratricopeptide (TPR) repeat protein